MLRCEEWDFFQKRIVGWRDNQTPIYSSKNKSQCEVYCKFCLIASLHSQGYKNYIPKEMKEFQELKIDENHLRTGSCLPSLDHHCHSVHSLYSATAISQVPAIGGIKEKLLKHMRACKKIPNDIFAAMLDSPHNSLVRQSSSGESSTQSSFSEQSRYPFSGYTKEEYHEHVVRAFISAGIAPNVLENPEMQDLFALITSYGPMSRYEFDKASGILQEDFKKLCIEEAKGKMATISTDGWTDVSGKYICSYLLTTLQKVSILPVVNNAKNLIAIH